MTTPARLINSLATHVSTVGAHRPAAQATRRWAQADSALAAHRHPASLAEAARDATPAVRDALLSSLLAVGAGDEWAELTALAILAPRLAWVLGRWARAGVTGPDLEDLEADLVGACWAAIRAAMTDPRPPSRPGLVLVDRAWSVARNRRTAARRRTRRLDPAPPVEPATLGDPRRGVDVLSSAIGDAHRAGVLGAGPARALFLTGVVGLSSAEAAGQLATTAGSVRALRSRAIERLGADLATGVADRRAA